MKPKFRLDLIGRLRTAMTRRRAARLLAQDALGRVERDLAHLAAIVSSSDDIIISKTLEGRIMSWNDAAQRVFGYTADEMIGVSIIRIIPPELHAEEQEILAKLRRGERIHHYETVRVAKDGRRVDVSLTVSPIRDRSGRLVGASKVARDIGERKRAERVQKLLIGELNHRVKNTLASVQAIARHTLRSTSNPADFVASFTGRIQSLARAHSMLSRGTWQGADLRELVHDQLLLGPSDEARMFITGAKVLLEPQQALHLALMLHELATNASKHGAFSNPNGVVHLSWTAERDRLRLTWAEQGCPMVTTPASNRGFGTKLIEESAKSEGGDARMTITPAGVTWDIALRTKASEQSDPISRMPGKLGARSEEPVSLVSKRFLVVEDEPLVALEIAGSLEGAGAQVAGIARSVQEAVSIIEATPVDGALLDANLAGQRVDDVAALLARRNVPFMFVTAYGPESLPQLFRGRDVVAKPVDDRRLLDAAMRLVKGLEPQSHSGSA